jgi:predicted amidohydrolase YtcJ
MELHRCEKAAQHTRAFGNRKELKAIRLCGFVRAGAGVDRLWLNRVHGDWRGDRVVDPGARANDRLIRGAERYPDGALVDVRLRDGRVVEIGVGLPVRSGDAVVEARGGALLPGLHDHHIHLFALAAARESVVCGPPTVTDAAALGRALRGHAGSGWLRGVGYHESVAGELHRRRLDECVADRPVRIQHASGKAWFLNTAAVQAVQLERYRHLDGVECDAEGLPTGRLFRLDAWLRERLAVLDPPDVGRVSRELAAVGVTGLTDTSPDNDPAAAVLFQQARAHGRLCQRVRLMGRESLGAVTGDDWLAIGELKILLDEDRLPDLDDLIARVHDAHRSGRGVALHCVSRTELVYALHALEEARGAPAAGRAGRSFATLPGDRIEHASVTPPELFPLLRALGVTVVTQPGFIAERGDRYLAEAEPDERPHLYRLRSFLDHGIPLGLSTDAPYGDPDPWAVIRAAVSRRTRGGAIVDPGEALTPEAALAGLLSRPETPGGSLRRIAPGAPADLCLLDRPWRAARVTLSAEMVRLTLQGGAVRFARGD